MKKLEIKMGEYFYEKVIKPVRTKQEIILLLLETLKLINNMEQDITQEKGKIVIYVDKMSRVFYQTENKAFSIYFPFILEKKEIDYRVYDSETNLTITDKMISLLISIIKKSEENRKSLEMVVDSICEGAKDFEYNEIEDIWNLFSKLWYMETGYIRYDYDPVHENKKLHPLHHLDVNYSGNVTYKLGLERHIKLEEMRDILDILTECKYLK